MTSQTLIDNCPHWSNYTNHDFVKLVVQETLPRNNFHDYLQQDNYYLQHYASAFQKLETLAQDKSLQEFAQHSYQEAIASEQSMQTHYAKLNLQLTNFKIKSETKNYVSFMEKISEQNNALHLLVALFPCAVGYLTIMDNLATAINPKNYFFIWVAEYAGDGFRNYVKRYRAVLDEQLVKTPVALTSAAQTIFNAACNLEIAFFNEFI